MMTVAKWVAQDIPVGRIFLDLKNPRHEPCGTESEAIEFLSRSEQVYNLARHIAMAGSINPLHTFAVTRNNDEWDSYDTFTVGDGNRRLCAVKLLADPELAPHEMRKQFRKLALNWDAIDKLPCVIFENKKDLRLWLEIQHNGSMDGVGKKDWSATQKARFSGDSSRNKIALQFLNAANKLGLISSEGRRVSITTVQRYLGNPIMREALGIDASDPNDIKRNRPEEDYILLTKRFIDDMQSRNPIVNSRKDKKDVETYARDLSRTKGLTNARIDSEPISVSRKKSKNKPKISAPPNNHNTPEKLPYMPEIHKALNDFGNWKLQSLYQSLHRIPLMDNTPLLAVGVWSFIETLTALAGRKDGHNILAFLSKERIGKYFGSKSEINTLRKIIERIQDFGNTTKHHSTSALFNGHQLHNDVESLGNLILCIIRDLPNDNMGS